jgi:succinate dehydrogenase / fumarate reductase iron-sulfur subunit
VKFTLHIWRQQDAKSAGKMVEYQLEDIPGDMSFLEMMDLLNEQLIGRGEDPVTFDSDCREGICGSCSMVIDGRAHGPGNACTACQVRMRSYSDGDHIWVEPFRSGAFPLIKDLMVDRSALDRIIEAGGYVTVHSGPKPEPNSTPIPHRVAEQAMDAAECIGCGACVAACPNGAGMLFTSAKIAHLGLLPQGEPEAHDRVLNMVHQMEDEGLGACTNHAECQDACPKEISIAFISRMNKRYIQASLFEPEQRRGTLSNQ